MLVGTAANAVGLLHRLEAYATRERTGLETRPTLANAVGLVYLPASMVRSMSRIVSLNHMGGTSAICIMLHCMSRNSNGPILDSSNKNSGSMAVTSPPFPPRNVRHMSPRSRSRCQPCACRTLKACSSFWIATPSWRSIFVPSSMMVKSFNRAKIRSTC